MKTLKVDGERLTLEQAVTAVADGAVLRIAARARTRVCQARTVVDRAVRERRVVYGVTTGFGAFSDVLISPDQTRQLQVNILRSHAAGVGPPLSDEEVRSAVQFMIDEVGGQ